MSCCSENAQHLLSQECNQHFLEGRKLQRGQQLINVLPSALTSFTCIFKMTAPTLSWEPEEAAACVRSHRFVMHWLRLRTALDPSLLQLQGQLSLADTERGMHLLLPSGEQAWQACCAIPQLRIKDPTLCPVSWEGGRPAQSVPCPSQRQRRKERALALLHWFSTNTERRAVGIQSSHESLKLCSTFF